MPLALTLALRNLLQDRLRFAASLTGIVFSVVLILVQTGLFSGFGRMVTLVIDHTPTDFWVVSSGTKYFEDLSILNEQMREELLKLEGVKEVVPVVAGFSAWMPEGGGMTGIFVIASDPTIGGVAPWNVAEGRVEDLVEPGAVAIDAAYAEQLGISAVGGSAHIRGYPVAVRAITAGIRSYTTTPYVFANFGNARSYLGLPAGLSTHFLIRTQPGAGLDRIRGEALSRVSGIQVLTPEQFGAQSRMFWLYRTGAGAALLAGALLAVIVGTVIVAQTLYASTKEHLSEFAMVRAIGASNSYIYRIIAYQALINAVIGLTIAGLIGVGVVRLAASSIIPITLSPELVAATFVLTLLMCIASSAASIVRVVRVDPAAVLTR